MAHAFNPSPWEAEAGGSKLEATLIYPEKLYLQINKQTNNNNNKSKAKKKKRKSKRS